MEQVSEHGVGHKPVAKWEWDTLFRVGANCSPHGEEKHAFLKYSCANVLGEVKHPMSA